MFGNPTRALAVRPNVGMADNSTAPNTAWKSGRFPLAVAELSQWGAEVCTILNLANLLFSGDKR